MVAREEITCCCHKLQVRICVHVFGSHQRSQDTYSKLNSVHLPSDSTVVEFKTTLVNRQNFKAVHYKKIASFMHLSPLHVI
jgi:hypothetical protein